jgi:Spy/CpxP family protein refolding chaperone
MRFAIPRRLLAVTLTAAVASACAAPLMQSSGRAPWSVQDAQGETGAAARSPFGTMRLLGQLDLSAQQKATIRDLLKAARQPHGGTWRQTMQDLRADLLAPTVDANQLETRLQHLQAKRGDQRDKFVTLAGEIRNVLTPEQRERLATLPQPKPHWFQRFAGKFADKPFDHMLAGLTLTGPQRAAVDNLKAAMGRQRETMTAHRQAMHEAFAAFARSGDSAALTLALQANAPHPPFHEIAQMAAALDQSQRQQIANRLREMRQRWQGRHHGGQPRP